MAQTTNAPSDASQAVVARQQSVGPLLDAVNRNPADYDALVKLGDMYYDGQQFSNAIQHYQRALAIHPESPDVRTDMATAYWYSGNADRALAELETSLKYTPAHPPTLFNLGCIRWQGKADSGSPAVVAGTLPHPHQTGKFLYVGNETGSLSIYSITKDVMLTAAGSAPTLAGAFDISVISHK